MYGQGNFNPGDFNKGLEEEQQEQYQQMQGQPMYMQQDMQYQYNQFQPSNMGLGPQVSAPDQFQYNNYQQQFQYDGQQQAAFQQPPPQTYQAPAQEQPAAAAPTAFKSSLAAMFGDKTKLSGGASEFVPSNHMANTKEQFPDLDALDDKPKKGKKGKKGKKVVQQSTQDEEADPSPNKGKPSEFFMLEQNMTEDAINPMLNPYNYQLNADQVEFLLTHYPAFMQEPTCYEKILELYMYTVQQEDLYSKPALGGQAVEGEEGEIDNDYDRGFGDAQKDNKKKSKQQEDARRKMEEKRKEQMMKKTGKVERTDAQKEEQKMIKAFKDKDVNMNTSDFKEVDTTRQPCSMVFIGHVDAGKSTICGNLMYQMGVVDQRTIQKYKEEAKDKGRDSWWLAYVMDVSDEEKAKGKTVEVGRATFDTPQKKYTIFDAPGHKNYVPNMIMGAALADIGGLVISARKGEFEAGFQKDGQTREHAQLAKSLGVQKLVIIVNKMDDCKWQKSRFDEIQTGLTPFLKGCGYKEEDLIYVPISGLSGENMSEKGGCNWYTGPPLIEVLDKIELDHRFPDGPLRIPILDKMKEKDIVIHGKIENGTIKHGDKLCIAPHGGLAQVLGLLDGKGDPVAYATPGENVQIRLNVADDDQVQRGFVLCHREKMMPVTEIFEAEMDVLELLDYKPILSKGYQCIMHAHTFNDEVIVKDIVKSTEITDKGTEVVKEKPQYTKSHTKIICRITPKNPIAIEKFDSIPQMGRFTLRDEGKTICVGRVLKYKPYSKGFVSLKKEEAKSNANGTVVINNNAKEMVYDMETGEMKPKPQAMDAIAEGDEDEN